MPEPAAPAAGAPPTPAGVPQPSTYYTPQAIAGDFLGKHIVTVGQFSRPDLEQLFAAATSLRTRVRQRDRGVGEIAAGMIMSLLFFESSTRTDLSFQAAMRRLGGEVVGVSNGIQFSSSYKGEDLHDTVRAAGCYADVITLRHPEAGASMLAAHYLDQLEDKIGRRPVVISAGDGIGEHPTQALLDLYTIFDLGGSGSPDGSGGADGSGGSANQTSAGSPGGAGGTGGAANPLDNLAIAMVGDLKHGRTVHSLARLICACEPSGTSLNLISPNSLRMPSEIIALCEAAGIGVLETDQISNALAQSNVIYWTRVQEERFADAADYDRIKDDFVMTPKLLEGCPDDALLMHPLPRKHEMGTRADHDLLDADPRSVYFQQMENGMFVRMALLAKVLRGAHV